LINNSKIVFVSSCLHQPGDKAMAVFDELLSANHGYQQSFDAGSLPMPPARHVAVVTCMDARLHPETFLGLQIGDAHVIRNAGGRVSEDAIRSLVISQRLLGTREVVVIHHTDCGMLTFTNDDLAAKIRDDLGVDASGRDFLPFPDLEQSVRDDVTIIRESPLLPNDIPVSGAIYDVTSGAVEVVVRDPGNVVLHEAAR
jgi:carbonic anhydrase